MPDNQEPIYLKYGDAQIDLASFLNNAANNLLSYLDNQPWSANRKQLFLDAYKDIMSKGVTGAINTSGVWEVTHNGEIDLSSYSKKQQEMYGEAAYYIQQLMKGLSPVLIAEKKKEDKIKFTNELFTKDFLKFFTNDQFGGNLYDIQEQWDSKDERDASGLRGRNVRAGILGNVLGKYASLLKEDDYDFTDTPFENFADLLTRLLTAASNLTNGTWDQNDIDSLNRIGLNINDLLNTGGNDILKKGNYEGTYLDYYNNYLPGIQAAQAKADADAKQAALLAAQQAAQQQHANQYKSYRILGTGLNGKLPNIKGDIYQYINGLAAKPQLNRDEQSELVGIFKAAEKGGGLLNLSKEELSKFGQRYINNPSRLKKLKGIEGFYWDSVGRRVLLPSMEVGNSFDLQSTIDKNTPEAKEKAYLESKIPGMTNAEWKELTAIGLDIASIIDPEPFTAGGAGITAAELRRRAINETPGHKWDLGLILGQGIDYLTGGLSAIPGFGDATLAAKLMTKISPALRIVGRLGAWKDLYDSIPGLEAVYDKWNKGEELTVGDWRLLGQGIRGLVAHGRMSKANLAERKVMEKSGITIKEAKNKAHEYLQKSGFARSKATTESTSPTIKVKIEGKEENITIKDKAAAEKAIKKAGSSTEAREKAVREIPEVKEKIESAAKSASKEVKDVDVTVEKASWRDNKYSPLRGTTSKMFGSESKPVPRGEDKFDEWLKDRSFWSRIGYGTNRYLQLIRRNLGITDVAKPSEEPKQEKKTKLALPSPTLVSTFNKNLDKSIVGLANSLPSGRQLRHAQAINNRLERIAKGEYNPKAPKAGTVEIPNGDKIQVRTQGKNRKGETRYKLDVFDAEGNQTTYARTTNVKTLKDNIAKVIERQHDKLNPEKLRELRKFFGLKYGGKINLEDTISEFLNKLK